MNKHLPKRIPKRERTLEIASLKASPQLGTRFKYSDAQHWIFFGSRNRGRFRLFPKGRRAGITRGAVHAAIEFGLEGFPCLWGDTVDANIRRYFKRYFRPALRYLGLIEDTDWVWNSQDKTLEFKSTGGYIDFRSATHPENWEGFGYRWIFLNEAGIIMTDRELYENSVKPMMLDYQDSELVAAGVPKGRNAFYEEYQKALMNEPGYYTPAIHMPPQPGQDQFAFTVFDNPWINTDSAKDFVDKMTEGVKEQEGLGQFVESDTAFRVIPRAWVERAMNRWRQLEAEGYKPNTPPDQIGGDCARGGKDSNVLSPRWGTYFGKQEIYPGKITPDGEHYASLLLVQQPERSWTLEPSTLVVVDVVGIGSSPYDHIKQKHSNTVGFNGGAGSEALEKNKQFGFINRRAEAFWKFRELLDPGNNFDVAVPWDLELMEQLCAHTYTLQKNGLKVDPKDEVAKLLSGSPDKADSLVMSYAMPDRPVATATGLLALARAHSRKQ